MILPGAEEKSRPPPPEYFSAPSASSGSSTSPGGSLRAHHWPLAASETALSPPTLHPLKPTHSYTYPPSPFSPIPSPAQPASFLRPPPSGLSPSPFKPMFLLADGNSLKRGFPAVLPPTTSAPHPFSQHDVSEADWTRFLDDLRTVAALSPRDRSLAYSVPILSAVPFINIALAIAIQHHIKRKKPRLVSLLVDKWNHHFFHPRNLSVVLMRGHAKLSGQSDTPVEGLYTPRTVPPVDPKAAAGGGEGDKTYRLFVVSMDPEGAA